MEEQITKKQHFVPQFYLLNFSDVNRNIWVFDKKRSVIYKSNIREVCFENYLYKNRWNNSNENGRFVSVNKIEKEFSIQEGKYAELLRKTISICNKPQNSNALIFKSTEKQLSASLVANLLLRNPWSIEQYLGEEDFAVNLEELQAYKEIIEMFKLGDLESIVKAAAKTEILSEQDAMFLPRTLKNFILKLHISVWIAPLGTQFITSSFPVIYDIQDISKNETSFKYIILPINPQLAISYSWIKDLRFTNRIYELSDTEVQTINRCNLNDNEQARLILSGNKKLLEKICLDKD